MNNVMIHGYADSIQLENVINNEIQSSLRRYLGPEYEAFLLFLAEDEDLQKRFLAHKAAKRILHGADS